jgi:beta-N-acetylhexosaminidase
MCIASGQQLALSGDVEPNHEESQMRERFSTKLGEHSRGAAHWMSALGVVSLLAVLVGCAGSSMAGDPSPTPTDIPTATPIATATSTATPIPNLDQRIDDYIATLTPQQQVGQTLLLAVYANGYNANLDQALTQWSPGGAVIFPNYNGGALMPSTLAGMRQLTHDLQAHARTPPLLATDEEGGGVDRLAPYYGSTPSPQALAATGDPHKAYAQAQTDAQRMRDLGLNVDFAPLADVYQGGGIEQSRTFGSTPATVTTYAGAFLDGLQQHGVAGTLKHWPGLGASSGNPDYTLPTVTHTQPQLDAIDFASFRQLLSHQPDLIMVTHVMVPAYDTQSPASLSTALVQQELRGQLGYQGVVVTDAMDAQGVIEYMSQQGYTDPAQGIAAACVRAFVAGDDLIEAPIEQDRLAAVATAMSQAVASGRISYARLHEALHRIIALKVKLGLIRLS